MRITGLDIQGFRAFTEEYSFDLDADVVLLTGANGRGKTSLFDAILWALTGSLPRLESQGNDPPLISLYSDTGQARVALRLRSGRKNIEVVRSDDGSEEPRIHVRAGDTDLRGESATHWIFTELWPLAQSAEKASEAFARALTRSVYLQQDLVRQFVDADSDRERFEAVSELVGAGRIGELNAALDTQRRKWKSHTNKLSERIQEKRRELDDTVAKREELGKPEHESLADLREAWKSWWVKADELGIEGSAPQVRDSDASSALDEAVKTLTALRQTAERQVSSASSLLSDRSELPSEDELPELNPHEDALENAKRQRDEVREALAQTRKAVAQKRKERIQQQEEVEELASLAELALRHIDERCPVCQQEHSVDHTRRHLRSLIKRADRESQSDTLQDTSEPVENVLNRLDEAEGAVAKAEEKLNEVRNLHRKVKQQTEALCEWLDDQHASAREDETVAEAVVRKQREFRDLISQIESHVEAGEQLALRLATVAQKGRREELSNEIEGLESDLEELESVVHSRNKASELADMLVNELEEATKRYVDQRLTTVGSLLQTIYSKVDPHPTFRVVRLLSTFSRRRGRLDPFVSDPDEDIGEQDPFAVMSSSQTNVVALSIFLALNLGIASVPLQTLILDDPVQSLDDINLLGLIDLIRRARGNRQIFLATHDRRLSSLIERKLRPVEESQRTRVLTFLKWTRQGPTVHDIDVERDVSPMRLEVA